MTGRGLHHSRRRVPTQLKKLRGTAEKSRDAKRKFESQPEVELTSEPPPWLTDEQQQSYRYAIAHAPRGLLKAIDKGALVIWCEAEIATPHCGDGAGAPRYGEGLAVPTARQGRPRGDLALCAHHPAASVIMLRAGDALGFTPASRPRLQLIPGAAPPPVIEGEVELDPWEALGRLHGRDVA